MDLERRKTLFRVCRSKEELRDWVHVFLDLELPDSVVDQESNASILDMAWNCYAHFTGQIEDPPTRVLYYGPRDGGKTLTQSVIEVLALLHLDVSIVHLAAIEEQSKNAQKYLKRFLNFPDLRGFVFGDNKRETAVQLYRPLDRNGVVLTAKEHKTLSEDEKKGYYLVENRAEIVVATIQSTNGKHSGILCLDGDTTIDVGYPRSIRDVFESSLLKYPEKIVSDGDSFVSVEAVDCYVKIFDTQIQMFDSERPTRVFRRWADRTVQICFDKGELILTPDHPIWTGTEYLQASDLKIGDIVSRGHGISEVLSISEAGPRYVYDFRIPNYRNFVANGFVVSNCLDEIDVIKSPAAYAESVNIPTQIRRFDGTVQQPLTILTSTRKSAFGFVQDEIDKADKTGLQINHFNILDVTEACKPERHRPELPHLRLWVSDEELRHLDDAGFEALNNKDKEKFVSHEAFAGCAKCPIFSACKTQLAAKQKSDSRFLKTIEYTIDRFRHNSIEMSQAQLLCRKPYSEGLIYPRLSDDRHILNPTEAYEKIFGESPGDGVSPDQKEEFIKNYSKEQLVAALQEHEFRWFGGIDWGSTHNFVYVVGVRVRNIFFWIAAISVPELEPDQMLEISEPMKRFSATVYGDTADPKMNKLFKKHGHKMILKWNKGAGTVQGGINVMRAKLNPPLGGDPEMFFVYDLVDEPDMRETFKRLKEYHWKKKPDGTWSNIPDEKDDDPCDATRYCVMNVFDPKGVLDSEKERAETSNTNAPIETEAPRNWLREEIQKRVEEPEPDALKGRAGRIMWDLS